MFCTIFDIISKIPVTVQAERMRFGEIIEKNRWCKADSFYLAGEAVRQRGHEMCLCLDMVGCREMLVRVSTTVCPIIMKGVPSDRLAALQPAFQKAGLILRNSWQVFTENVNLLVVVLVPFNIF